LALLPIVVNVGELVRGWKSHGTREARFCTSRSHSSSVAGGLPTVASQHQSSRMSVLGKFHGSASPPSSG
jgi:hypothetical protein